MGYHPKTLVASFPSYKLEDSKSAILRGIYNLSPWIGLHIWHVDPERPDTGQRTDDSCGWFDRRPGEYEEAVRDFLSHKEAMSEVRRILGTARTMTSAYGHDFKRLTVANCFSVVVMIAHDLERSRARVSKTKQRDILSIALSLSTCPTDNLWAVNEADVLVRLVAAAMNRHFRPWHRHPRWHVHHWQLDFQIVHTVRRMFQKCASCNRPIGARHSPVISNGKLFHNDCPTVPREEADR